MLIRSLCRRISQFKATVNPGYTLLNLKDETPGLVPAIGVMLRSAEYPLAAYLWEKLAFRSTVNLSPQQMQSKLDGLVGAVQAKSSREHLLFSGAIVPEQQQQLFDLLWEVVHNPQINAEDLEEMKQVIAYERGRLEEKPEDLLPEMIYGVAYGGKDKGSLLGFESQLTDVSEIREQLRQMSKDPIIVTINDGKAALSIGGVSEGEFATVPFTAPEYRGGELRVEREEMPLVHMALAFPAPAAGHSDSYATAILQMLLGGGGSFSAGGPGKGMYSRLYTQVLNRLHWCECARYLHHPHSHRSLFGIYGAALPSYAADLANTLVRQLQSLADPIGAAELQRARRQVASALLMGYESRLVQVEDVASQWLQTASYTPIQEMVDRVMSVHPREINRVASEMLSHPPSLISMGPLKRMPLLRNLF